MSQEKTTLEEAEDRSETSFVSRWSRLKHEAAKDTETATIENTTSSNTAADNTEPGLKQASSTRILTDEDMPDIESLTPESDYTDFLSPGVSDALRKRALRTLFHGEAFNIRDGLDEYDDDFTQFEKLGDIVTSDMRHQLDLEAQRKAQQLLKNEDQSSDAARIHDLEIDDTINEPVEENVNIAVNTARNNGQSHGIQKPADGENDNEAEDDTLCDEKAIINKRVNHD